MPFSNVFGDQRLNIPRYLGPEVVYDDAVHLQCRTVPGLDVLSLSL